MKLYEKYPVKCKCLYTNYVPPERIDELWHKVKVDVLEKIKKEKKEKQKQKTLNNEEKSHLLIV